LVSSTRGPAGRAVFTVNCPYVLTAGKLELETAGKGEIWAEVSTDKGASWKGIPAGEVFRDPIEGSLSGYLLRLTVPAGAGLTGLKLTSHFQLNAYALPHLAPGKNVISVAAEDFGAPLAVAYKWSEGSDWSEKRSARRTFKQAGSFEIEVPGRKYPRMRELVLSVAP
jgi:hypothetical protein